MSLGGEDIFKKKTLLDVFSAIEKREFSAVEKRMGQDVEDVSYLKYENLRRIETATKILSFYVKRH